MVKKICILIFCIYTIVILNLMLTVRLVDSSANIVIPTEKQYSIPILVYHRIGYTTDDLTVSPEKFEQDLIELKKNNYTTITISTFEDLLNGYEVNLPPKPILITFDDGYDDNYLNAFPILQRNQMTATFFIITNLINTPNRMTTEEIKIMQLNGMFFGSHTANHLQLANLDKETIWSELVYSKKKLEDTLNISIYSLAYPTGNFDDKVIKVANDMGYEFGFTIKLGICTNNSNKMELPRIPIFRFNKSVILEINKNL